ncbi:MULTISPECIES: RAQPRD family integrative conjugative element protein [Pseudomonas syringae group genomosp. 2]|uniref:VirB5 n=2 Tax=Pseudomonas syringae group TaxID=136849 RepID=A0A0Q0ENA7_PSEA0|nr:RAQPRD family integrative conjugative element protein [Pseudomonas savastanoi]KPZ12422.1 hypothetical protein ALO41_200045 [Pseudomonas amygdali pv. ulmi]PAB26727.1 hypothetical protein CCZ00_23535 [Pseudomonas savastanoi pv. fraxini]
MCKAITTHCKITLFSIVLGMGVASTCTAASSDAEQVNLELMLRQLESVKRVAERSATLPESPGQRYHFDYQRLQKDLDSVQAGIKSHLSPSRAQPRDPGALSGHYTRTGSAAP